MKINVKKIEDDLEGNWWNHISIADFSFQETITNRSEYEVKLDDILIHKQILDGDNFPTIVYHKIVKEGTNIITNAQVKNLLEDRLVKYIKKNKTFPNFCSVAKFFKNGAAQVNYKPTRYDSFALKIIPEVHNITDVKEFLSKVKTTKSKTPSKAKEWDIASKSNPRNKYTVIYSPGRGWTCTCPQYTFRKATCKHIQECKNKIR